ncbi:prenyltransferase, partial [Actinomadura sp. HBU206391]|nr:prenyltransferase [Actinomadura sp. HBU206391]
MPRSDAAAPSVPGVLTAEQVAAAARSIASQQEPSGAIPWFAPIDGVPGH